jgi:predicted Fe-Mo cluster-binding NifX family protein
MRAVFTIWNDRIAPVFDVAGQALVVVLENGATLDEEDLLLPASSALAKVASLAEARVNVLICGAISRPACFAAKACGIEVHSFIAGTVREVIEAWLHGRLEDSVFAMPGCGRKNACRRRRPGM